MKAIMTNSNTTSVVEGKMRDEVYMRHLRQVEKINNREAQQIAKDIHTYRSINDLHHKHKVQAFDWQHRQLEQSILLQNKRIFKKITSIRPYTRFPHANEESSPSKAKKEGEQPRGDSSPARSHERRGKGLSLHYQYRKRRQ